MNERDMYYGYNGFFPLPNQMTGFNSSQFNNVNYYNDFNNRIERLERQIKRFDQRLARLETPYANNNYANNEPDNSMYMM